MRPQFKFNFSRIIAHQLLHRLTLIFSFFLFLEAFRLLLFQSIQAFYSKKKASFHLQSAQILLKLFTSSFSLQAFHFKLFTSSFSLQAFHFKLFTSSFSISSFSISSFSFQAFRFKLFVSSFSFQAFRFKLFVSSFSFQAFHFKLFISSFSFQAFRFKLFVLFIEYMRRLEAKLRQTINFTT